MQLPNLTPDQIQECCTAQSFTRGTEYFHAGTIGNPILHGYTLSATCHGTCPYRVSVELMPTGIATTHCSCPYDGDGDCKHIVALLLTYLHTPDLIDSIDSSDRPDRRKTEGESFTHYLGIIETHTRFGFRGASLCR